MLYNEVLEIHATLQTQSFGQTWKQLTEEDYKGLRKTSNLKKNQKLSKFIIFEER